MALGRERQAETPRRLEESSRYSPEPALGFVRRGDETTLTEQMGLLLIEAEERFGPRDRDFTPLGIQFDRERPCISVIGGRFLTVNLTFAARSDPERAYFQMAHEVVHMLSPGQQRSALAIEEGLATIFSEEKSKGRYQAVDRAYVLAKEFLQPLLDDRPDLIKVARAAQPDMKLWTPAFLDAFAPGQPANVLALLCEPFDALEARFG